MEKKMKSSEWGMGKHSKWNKNGEYLGKETQKSKKGGHGFGTVFKKRPNSKNN